MWKVTLQEAWLLLILALILPTLGQQVELAAHSDAGSSSVAAISSKSASASQQAAGALQTAAATTDVNVAASSQVRFNLLDARPSSTAPTNAPTAAKTAIDGQPAAGTAVTPEADALDPAKAGTGNAVSAASAIPSKALERAGQASKTATMPRVMKEAPAAETNSLRLLWLLH